MWTLQSASYKKVRGLSIVSSFFIVMCKFENTIFLFKYFDTLMMYIMDPLQNCEP
jgi:hypothetical protein